MCDVQRVGSFFTLRISYTLAQSGCCALAYPQIHNLLSLHRVHHKTHPYAHRRRTYTHALPFTGIYSLYALTHKCECAPHITTHTQTSALFVLQLFVIHPTLRHDKRRKTKNSIHKSPFALFSHRNDFCCILL
jgi:hypothetical protein